MFGTFLVPGIFPWNFRIFFGPLEIGPLLNFPVVSENMTQCLCIRILDHVQRFYQILTPAEHTALRHTGFGAEFVQCFFPIVGPISCSKASQNTCPTASLGSLGFVLTGEPTALTGVLFRLTLCLSLGHWLRTDSRRHIFLVQEELVATQAMRLGRAVDVYFGLQ